MRVHAADNSSDTGLLVVAGRWMGDIGAEEDHGLVEDLWPDGRHEDAVDAAQFNVDLQAQVGQRLRRCLVYVLGLYALRGHAQQSVADSLHFGCKQKQKKNFRDYQVFKSTKKNYIIETCVYSYRRLESFPARLRKRAAGRGKLTLDSGTLAPPDRAQWRTCRSRAVR